MQKKYPYIKIDREYITKQEMKEKKIKESENLMTKKFNIILLYLNSKLIYRRLTFQYCLDCSTVQLKCLKNGWITVPAQSSKFASESHL